MRGGGTVRVDELRKFGCTVDDLRREVGDLGLAAKSPYPCGPEERPSGAGLCAGDLLIFQEVQMPSDGLPVFRIVSHIPEGGDAAKEIRCAIYGRREGPRRQLRDGSWSVRVRPFAPDEALKVAEAVRMVLVDERGIEFVARVRLMVLVRETGHDDEWREYTGIMGSGCRLPDDW